jgi:hypothetical protein
MYLPRTHEGLPPRRGIILLVVLVMLTLFTVVGVSFVFYADSEAFSSRVYRESENLLPQENGIDPGLAFAYFLNQLIYDVNDKDGVYSSMRGHSLLRNMYGLNYQIDGNGTVTMGTNNVPFNGTGRLHNQINISGQQQDDYTLLNYMYFLADGFLRDPERSGTRAGLPPAGPNNDNRGPYVGGFNAPYTYPDLNMMALAAVKADGTLLVPSFHRPWVFNPSTAFNDMTNPNWTNAIGKYLTVRPRPADHMGFPNPADATGDVKNMVGAPGGNDSIWMDLGAPVVTLPDGTKAKMLFAPLIIDLDNRVNLNVHGNVRGLDMNGKPVHVSNQGWGPWEVDLQPILNFGATAVGGGCPCNPPPPPANGATGEWTRVFLGVNASLKGRYGPDQMPNTAGTVALPGTSPHFLGQVDFNGCQDDPDNGPANPNKYTLSQQFFLPQGNNGGLTMGSVFPSFPTTSWNNGSQFERTNHPLNYNVFKPVGDDRRFPTSEMAALLRFGDKGSALLTSDLLAMLPNNFSDPNDPAGAARRRRLVTTDSFDPDRPGATPWYWNAPTSTPYKLAAGANAPYASALPFPPLPNSPNAGEYGQDWRSTIAALGRLDLNRPLPNYPSPDQKTGRITDTTGFSVAQQARVDFANDIYQRFLAVTGNPTDAGAQRWLAQLAVNIVDYVDPDDYITPFPYDPSNPANIVYGTEVPRVVINEAYVEGVPDKPVNPVNRNYGVWVELHNPFNVDSTLSDNGAAKLEMADSTPGANDRYGIYQVVLAKNDHNNLQDPTNTDGHLSPAPNSPILTSVVNTPCTLSSFSPAGQGAVPNPDPRIIQPANGSDGPGGPGPSNNGFYLLGPKTNPAPNGSTNFPKSTWPADEMTYSTPIANTVKPTIVLQRLCCPHLPPNPKTVGGQVDNTKPFNPYITVDYTEDVPVNDGTNMTWTTRVSWGRIQPYAGNPDPLTREPQQPNPLNTTQPQHTFYTSNLPGEVPADWLVHLDRQLISPMELLHVSAYKPHLLTQQFIVNQGGSRARFQHYAPWFDQNIPTGNSALLYRLFEFVETRNRASGLAAVTTSSPNQITAGNPATITPAAMSGTTTSGVSWSFQQGTVVVIQDPDGTLENVRVASVTGTNFTANVQKNHPAGANIILTSTGDRIPGKVNINTIWDPETFRALCDANDGTTHFKNGDVDAAYNALMNSRTPGGTPAQNDVPFWSLAAGLTNAGDTQYPNGLGINNTFLRSATGGDGNTARLFQYQAQGQFRAHPYLNYEIMTKIYNNVTVRSNVFAVWCTVGFFQVMQDTDASGNPVRPVKLGAEIGSAANKQVRYRMFAVVDRSVFPSNPGPQQRFDPRANPALVPYFSIID